MMLPLNYLRCFATLCDHYTLFVKRHVDNQKPLPIGRSENKSLTQFPPFEDEARPGVANRWHGLWFKEFIVFVVLIK